MVTSLCQSLNWWNLYNQLSQFVDRINFSIQDELEDPDGIWTGRKNPFSQVPELAF